MAVDIVLASELGTEFDIGVVTANKITVKVDGTSIVKSAGVLGAASPVWDNTAKTITFPAVNGAAPVVVDLSQFVVDIYVNGATFNSTTRILTLTDTDGTSPDVTVDLSLLLGVSADAGNLLTAGTDQKAFINKAAVLAIGTAQASVFGTALGYTINP